MANAKFLTALPVFNEVQYVDGVLDEVLRHSPHVLVVDDGSSDGTAACLARRSDIRIVTHAENRGYGAALASAFDYATRHDYEVLVTIDCDGQHQPRLIPDFVAASERADIVSGSRYLARFPGDSVPPVERRRINHLVTEEINSRLGLKLTDAFCGFKSYRTCALRKLHITEMGYAMPLELWAQAALAHLSIIELPVPLLYLDAKRSFGGALDDANTRLEYYQLVLNRSLAVAEERQAGRRQLGRSSSSCCG